MIAVVALSVTSGAAAAATSSKEKPIQFASQAAHHASSQLIFRSDFSKSTLNPKIWDTCYPWANARVGCTNFGNPEYEWYLPSQVRVSDGILDLVAQRLRTKGQTSSGAPETYVCRSGMVTTYPGFRFKYGYMKVVARLPDVDGLWSALWLGPVTLKWPPEVDLIEYWGRQTNPAGVFFHPYGGVQMAEFPSVGDLGDGWHTFALDWTPSRLTMSIDGRHVLSTSQHVPQQPMFFLATLAYTSTNKALIESGSGCNGTLSIKSIKVWQQS